MNERSASNSLQKENRSKKLSSQNDESKDNDANTDSIALRRSKRISKRVRDSELSPFVYEHYCFKPSFFPRIKKRIFPQTSSNQRYKENEFRSSKSNLMNVKEEQKDTIHENRNKIDHKQLISKHNESHTNTENAENRPQKGQDMK